MTRPIASERVMMEKLKQEILALEKWLASQQMGTTYKGFKGSSVSLVPTIESLIETRRTLLASLESACKSLSE